jgi:hypothetical protein
VATAAAQKEQARSQSRTIHANLPALEATLIEIERLGINTVYCGGDLVGYGRHPNKVCALSRERAIPTIPATTCRRAREACFGLLTSGHCVWSHARFAVVLDAAENGLKPSPANGFPGRFPRFGPSRTTVRVVSSNLASLLTTLHVSVLFEGGADVKGGFWVAGFLGGGGGGSLKGRLRRVGVGGVPPVGSVVEVGSVLFRSWWCDRFSFELSRLLNSSGGRQAARTLMELAGTVRVAPRGRLGLNGCWRESMCQAAVRTFRATADLASFLPLRLQRSL